MTWLGGRGVVCLKSACIVDIWHGPPLMVLSIPSLKLLPSSFDFPPLLPESRQTPGEPGDKNLTGDTRKYHVMISTILCLTIVS